MNTFYQTKFNELFREFTRYLVEHPEFSEHIPDNAKLCCSISMTRNTAGTL